MTESGCSSYIQTWEWHQNDMVPLSCCYPRLYGVALFSKGTVAKHPDENSSSWSIIFRRLLKEDEIIEFQNFIGQISARRPFDNFDRRM